MDPQEQPKQIPQSLDSLFNSAFDKAVSPQEDAATSMQESDAAITESAADSVPTGRILNPPVKDVEPIRVHKNLAKKAPVLNYQTLQSAEYNQQSWGEQFVNFLDQGLIGEVVGGGIESFGYLTDLPSYIDILKGTEAEWGNALSDIGKNIKHDRQTAAPIYEKKPGEFNPSDWGFWFKNGTSVFSTLSLMIPSGLATRGLSKLVTAGARASSRAGRYGKLTKNILEATDRTKNIAKGITMATTSRHMENYMEAAQVYDQKLAEFQEQVDEGLMTQEAANNAASKAAAFVYRTNYAMLLQDIPQYMLLGRLTRGARSAKAIGKGGKVGAEAAKRSNFWKNTRGLVLDAAGEGFEEAFQHIVSEEGQLVADRYLGRVSEKSFGQRLNDYLSSDELWTSALFGALGSVVMQKGVPAVKNAAVKGFDAATGRTRRSKEVIIARQKRMLANLDMIKAADESQDPDLMQAARTRIGQSMAYEAIAGGDKYLDQHYEMLNSLREEAAEKGAEGQYEVEAINKIIEFTDKAYASFEKHQKKYSRRAAFTMMAMDMNISELDSAISEINPEENEDVARELANLPQQKEAQEYISAAIEKADAQRALNYYKTQDKTEQIEGVIKELEKAISDLDKRIATAKESVKANESLTLKELDNKIQDINFYAYAANLRSARKGMESRVKDLRKKREEFRKMSSRFEVEDKITEDFIDEASSVRELKQIAKPDKPELRKQYEAKQKELESKERREKAQIAEAKKELISKEEFETKSERLEDLQDGEAEQLYNYLEKNDPDSIFVNDDNNSRAVIRKGALEYVINREYLEEDGKYHYSVDKTEIPEQEQQEDPVKEETSEKPKANLTKSQILQNEVNQRLQELYPGIRIEFASEIDKDPLANEIIEIEEKRKAELEKADISGTTITASEKAQILLKKLFADPQHSKIKSVLDQMNEASLESINENDHADLHKEALDAGIKSKKGAISFTSVLEAADKIKSRIKKEVDKETSHLKTISEKKRVNNNEAIQEINRWYDSEIRTLKEEIGEFNSEDSEGNVKGKSKIDAMLILIDPKRATEDTLAHEYAHHYIEWFANTPIVQEAIQKWGSKEKLVQAMGERAISQEAKSWWDNFLSFVRRVMEHLHRSTKEQLRDALTAAMMNRMNLNVPMANFVIIEGQFQQIEDRNISFRDYDKQAFFDNLQQSYNWLSSTQVDPEIRLEGFAELLGSIRTIKLLSPEMAVNLLGMEQKIHENISKLFPGRIVEIYDHFKSDITDLSPAFQSVSNDTYVDYNDVPSDVVEELQKAVNKQKAKRDNGDAYSPTATVIRRVHRAGILGSKAKPILEPVYETVTFVWEAGGQPLLPATIAPKVGRELIRFDGERHETVLMAPINDVFFNPPSHIAKDMESAMQMQEKVMFVTKNAGAYENNNPQTVRDKPILNNVFSAAYLSHNNTYVQHREGPSHSDVNRSERLASRFEDPEFMQEDVQPFYFEIDYNYMVENPDWISADYADETQAAFAKKLMESIANRTLAPTPQNELEEEVINDILGEIPLKLVFEGEPDVFAHLHTVSWASGSFKYKEGAEEFSNLIGTEEYPKESQINDLRALRVFAYQKLVAGVELKSNFLNKSAGAFYNYNEIQEGREQELELLSPVFEVFDPESTVYISDGTRLRSTKDDVGQPFDRESSSGGIYIFEPTANGESIPLRMYSMRVREREANFVFDLYKRVLAGEIKMDSIVPDTQINGEGGLTAKEVINLLLFQGKYTGGTAYEMFLGNDSNKKFGFHINGETYTSAQAMEQAREQILGFIRDGFRKVDINKINTPLFSDIQSSSFQLFEKQFLQTEDPTYNNFIADPEMGAIMTELQRSKDGRIFVQPSVNFTRLDYSEGGEPRAFFVAGSSMSMELDYDDAVTSSLEIIEDIEDEDSMEIFRESNLPYEQTNVSEEISEVQKLLNIGFRTTTRLVEIAGREGFGAFVSSLEGLADFDGATYGIYLSTLQPAERSKRGTAYHEAWHAVFELWLTEEEQEAIYKQSEKKYGLTGRREMDEMLAEDFRAYSNRRKAFKQRFTSRYKFIDNLFNALFELLEAFKNPSEFRKVASKIHKGHYKDLKPVRSVTRRQLSKTGLLSQAEKTAFTNMLTGLVTKTLLGASTVVDYNVLINPRNITYKELEASMDAVLNHTIVKLNKRLGDGKITQEKYDESVKKYAEVKKHKYYFIEQVARRLSSLSISTEMDPDVDEGKNDNTGRDTVPVEFYKRGSRQTTSTAVKILLSSIEKREVKKTTSGSFRSVPVINPHTQAVEFVNYEDTWNFLKSELSGIVDSYTKHIMAEDSPQQARKELQDTAFAKMITRMRSLARVRPELAILANSLESESLPEMVKGQFFRSMSGQKINYSNTYVDRKTIKTKEGVANKFTYNMGTADTLSKADKMMALWEGNLFLSDLVKYVPEVNVSFIDPVAFAVRKGLMQRHMAKLPKLAGILDKGTFTKEQDDKRKELIAKGKRVNTPSRLETSQARFEAAEIIRAMLQLAEIDISLKAVLYYLDTRYSPDTISGGVLKLGRSAGYLFGIGAAKGVFTYQSAAKLSGELEAELKANKVLPQKGDSLSVANKRKAAAKNLMRKSDIIKKLKEFNEFGGNLKNPMREQDFVKDLAEAEAITRGDMTTNTVVVAKGNMYSSYVDNHYVSKMLARIKEEVARDGRSAYLDELMTIPYYRNSLWLKELQSQITLGKLQLNHYGQFVDVSSRDQGDSYTDVKPLDDLSSRIVRTLFDRIDEKREAEHFFPTPADKSAIPILQGIRSYRVDYKEAPNGSVTMNNRIIDIFIGYLSDELDRINSVYRDTVTNPIDENYKIQRYHPTADFVNEKEKFLEARGMLMYMFPELSPKYLMDRESELYKLNENFGLYNYETMAPNEVSLEDLMKNKHVRKYIQKKIQELVEQGTEQIEEEGVFLANGESTLDHRLVDYYKEQYGDSYKRSLVADYLVNTAIDNVEVSKVFAADPAKYKNLADYAKRLAELTAPGSDPLIFEDTPAFFTIAHAASIIKPSEFFTSDEFKDLYYEYMPTRERPVHRKTDQEIARAPINTASYKDPLKTIEQDTNAIVYKDHPDFENLQEGDILLSSSGRNSRKYIVIDPHNHVFGHESGLDLSSIVADVGGTRQDYVKKDAEKFRHANKLIARGSKVSSPNKYAEAIGGRANVGEYKSSDVVGISTEIQRKGRVEFDKEEVKKAIDAGVTFIIDNANDRNKPKNIGNREVAQFLNENGYYEVGQGFFMTVEKYGMILEDLSNRTGKPVDQMAEILKQPMDKYITDYIRLPKENKTARGELVYKTPKSQVYIDAGRLVLISESDRKYHNRSLRAASKRIPTIYQWVSNNTSDAFRDLTDHTARLRQLMLRQAALEGGIPNRELGQVYVAEYIQDAIFEPTEMLPTRYQDPNGNIAIEDTINDIWESLSDTQKHTYGLNSIADVITLIREVATENQSPKEFIQKQIKKDLKAVKEEISLISERFYIDRGLMVDDKNVDEVYNLALKFSSAVAKNLPVKDNASMKALIAANTVKPEEFQSPEDLIKSLYTRTGLNGHVVSPEDAAKIFTNAIGHSLWFSAENPTEDAREALNELAAKQEAERAMYEQLVDEERNFQEYWRDKISEESFYEDIINREKLDEIEEAERRKALEVEYPTEVYASLHADLEYLLSLERLGELGETPTERNRLLQYIEENYKEYYNSVLTGGVAAFYDKTSQAAYFVEGRYNASSVVHEYTHPFVDILYQDNRQVFDSIYKEIEATETGQKIIAYVQKRYTQLGYTQEAIQKEIMVWAVQWAAENNLDKNTGHPLRKAVERILNAIRTYLQRLFAQSSIKPTDLTLQTTLQDVADILTLYKGEIDIGLGGSSLASDNVNIQLETQEEKRDRLQERLDGYEEVDQTDAQGYITLKRFRDIMRSSGKWDNDKHQAVYEKLENGQPVTDEEIAGFFTQPIKGMIYDHQIQDVKNAEGGTTKQTANLYIKYSQFPLFPALVKGTKLEAVLDYMKKNGVDEIVYDSGSKGAKQGVKPLDGANIELHPISIRTEAYKIQQTNPVKYAKKGKSLEGSQHPKNILVNIVGHEMYGEFTGNGIKQELHNVHSAISNTLTKDLLLSMGIDPESKDIVLDAALRDFIADQMLNRDIPEQTVRAFRNGAPIQSLLVEGDKVQNTLMSIINKAGNVNKMPGAPFIQASNALLDATEQIEKLEGGIDNRGIIWLNEGRELQPPKLNKETGEFTPGEILLPHSALEAIPGYPNLTADQVKNYFADKQEVLEGIAYRIPNQALSSIVAIKVVGFLPKSVGDTAIFFKEITTITGGDFDIDKANIMLYHLKKHGKGLKKVQYMDENTNAVERYFAYMQEKKTAGSIFLDPEEARATREWMNAMTKAARLSFESARNELDSSEMTLREKEDQNNPITTTIEQQAVRLTELYGQLNPDLQQFMQEFTDNFELEDDSIMQQITKLAIAQRIRLDNLDALGDVNISDRDFEIIDDIYRTIETITAYTNSNSFEKVLNDIADQLKIISENKDMDMDMLTEAFQERKRSIKLSVASRLAQAAGYESFEDFLALPIQEQNTLKALQNYKLDLYRAILEHPKTYAQSVTPLDASDLKKDLDFLHGVDSDEIGMEYFTDYFQLKIKDRNLVGKNAIGQTANHLVAHPLSQGLLHININLGRGNTKMISDNGVQRRVSSLGEHVNEDGIYISDVINAFLNAFVDNPKDPYVGKGNYNTYTNDVAFLMYRAGVSMKFVNRFIGHPIMQELLKTTRSSDGKLFESPYNREEGRKKTPAEIVRAKYGLRKFKASPEKLDLSLIDMERLEKDILNKEISDPEFASQVLDAYENLKIIAKDLAAVNRAMKSDTVGGGKNLNHANYMEILRARATSQQFIGGVEGVLNTTFLRTMHENTSVLAREVFQNMFFNTTAGGFGANLGVVTSLGKGSSYTNVLLDQITNQYNAFMYGGSPTVQNLSGIEDLLMGPNNISYRFYQLKDKLAGFQLFNYISFPVVRQYDKYPTIPRRNNTKGMTASMREILIEEWESLIYDKDLGEEVNQFGRDLAAVAYQTSGFYRGLGTFYSLIPPTYLAETGMGDYVNENLVSLEAYPDAQVPEIFHDQFYRNRVNRKHVRTVPDAFVLPVKGSKFSSDQAFIPKNSHQFRKENGRFHSFVLKKISYKEYDQVQSDIQGQDVYNTVQINDPKLYRLAGIIVYQIKNRIVEEPVYIQTASLGYMNKGSRVVEYNPEEYSLNTVFPENKPGKYTSRYVFEPYPDVKRGAVKDPYEDYVLTNIRDKANAVKNAEWKEFSLSEDWYYDYQDYLDAREEALQNEIDCK